MKKFAVLTASIFALGMAGGATAQDKASATRGKQIYERTGCWQCHGYVGQGGGGAVKLAPEPLPLDAMIAFVRNSNRNMPAYSEKILSDADLADIHAFLESLPAPKSVDSIPLLKNLKPPQ